MKIDNEQNSILDFFINLYILLNKFVDIPFHLILNFLRIYECEKETKAVHNVES